MTATTIRVQMAQRKDTAANWTAANPILLSGEIGYETDTKKFKIGDGTTNWNSLAYLPIPDGSGNLTITGNLEIGTTGSLTFEGSTANGFETTLAVTDPTADRTITLPNVSGTIITTGDTGSVTSTMLLDGTIVNADISGSAEIAVSKLANGTANQVIVTDGTNVSWSDNLTLAGDLTVNGTTTTINTQDLLVEDKNIIIGNVTSPTDVTADGGGITLKGTTDKTINWVDSTDAWTSSERFSYPLGSATAPALTFTGDPNTGIYSPGADQVAISTSGTQRVNFGTGEVVFNETGENYDFRIEGDTEPNLVFIDASTNRVGLGTSSPNAPLMVQGSSQSVIRAYTTDTGTSNQILFDNGSNYHYGAVGTVSGNTTTTGDVFGLGYTASNTTDFTPVLSWTANTGRVGIGDNAPGSTLTVKGATGVAPLQISGPSSEFCRVTSDGKLLVGTSTSPSAVPGQYAKVVIQGYTGDTGGAGEFSIQRGQAAASIASGADIGSIRFNDSAGYSFAGISCYADAAPGASDYPGRLVFSTTADGASSPTERIHIKSNTEVQWRNVTELFPFTDNSCLLGKSGYRWSAVWAANGTIQTSDQRAKTAINDSQLGSEFIKTLRPVSYKWVEGGQHHTGEYDKNGDCIYETLPGTRTHWGFIAQEVKEAVDAAGVDFGGWVLTDKDDPDSQQALRYDQFIAPLTKALQEALTEIDILKAKVAALEGV